MITISPGHHSLSPGARNGEHSEHAEACIWAGLIAAQVPWAQLVTGTTKQKIAAIDALRPSLAVELHFGSRKIDSASGTLLLAAGQGGEAMANTLCGHLSKLPSRVVVSSGHYADSNGVDFFIAGVKACMALIVCVDDFKNLQGIQAARVQYCAALAEGLRTCDLVNSHAAPGG